MSASESQTNSHPQNDIIPVLDITKLHALPSEQQDLFLLTFVADFRQHVLAIPAPQLPNAQAEIKKEVVKVVGLSTPAPSRIIRQSLGHILADIFTRGSRQLLVETINDLLGFINAAKSEREISTRFAATVCLGHVYKSAGDSAISLHGLVISSLLKLVKIAQTHTGFRASIFRSLSQCVEGLGTGIDEVVARDIWKQVRANLASEKSALVQSYSFLCVRSLFVYNSYFVNANDFELFKAMTWKGIESNVLATRNTVCNSLAQVSLRFYNENKGSDQVPMARKPKKSNKSKAGTVEDDVEAQKPDDSASKSVIHFSLSLVDILKLISGQYCKTSTSNKARCGLALCYKHVFEHLPEKVIKDHYGEIADHFFNDVLGFISTYTNRVRLLLSRRIVHTLLGELIGTRLLSENGQIQAARWLVNDILKNYPQVLPGRREPSKHTLTAALRVLSQLLAQLGPASTVLQDSCREALFQVATHPSYTVQVHVAQCLKQFVAACPTQLARTLENAHAQLRKQFEQVDGRVSRRVSVYALSLAAMLRAAQDTPLYGSIEIYCQIFSYATELLKASATSELRLCAAQVLCAWTLLGGLMTLGPNFVKVHLNQLLLLWRNALPAPLSNENTSRRSQLELSFLTNVRESALTALSAFLEYNSNLLTSDGSRRISAMLQNSIAFANSLPPTRQTEDLSNRLFSALQLHDHAVNLRRRILQCTIKLLSLKHIDRNEILSLSDTVGMSIKLFADPMRPVQRSVEAALASSVSSFEGIWDLSDNWAYGVNSMVENFDVVFPANGRMVRIGTREAASELLESSLNLMASQPLVSAPEHDSTALYCDSVGDDTKGAYPPETACVTLAIQLFAAALPLQPPRIQESCLEQVATVLAQPLQREPGRKFALQINATTALLCTLAVANGETGFHTGKLAIDSTSKILAEIARRGVLDQDAIMRSIATQTLGRLCYLAGSPFTNTEVKNVIDTIVANREPRVRAGCALALGTIHSQVGAMAASYHLKNIMSVLFTLCSDPHPIVHFWSLKGLSEVAESAGLSFSAYGSSTLGMLARLYSSDFHNQESPSIVTSSSEMEFETPIVIGQCIDSVINVLGPDLQDVAKARNLILSLIQYFQIEDIQALQLQRYICLGHISLYAPAHVQLASYVHNLQNALDSDQPLLEEIAISGLENLVKRNASEVFLVAEKGLAETLWFKLDQQPTHQALRNMIRTWMQQTCLDETLFWIEQCQSILSRSRVKAESKSRDSVVVKPKTAVPDLADEEVAGFAAAAAVAEGEKAETVVEGQEFMRWQTRDFAMSILSEMLDIVRDAILVDQIIDAESVLQSNVAEIVRVAFAASTAIVVELRVRGLHILDQILKLFGRTPDPDFLEASLLEQYQAQISSALTPAFAVDSNAELAAEAVAVCATFVATGIVTSEERMGRIFKVLSGGLDNFSKDNPESSIGDLKNLSSNSQSMLKMALLSGWAQLQLASTEQTYLEDIVRPYVPKLAPLWLESLQEFASLRFEPEISDSLGDFVTNDLRERYAALDREIRLVFYQKSWLSIVDAIAQLVEKDSNAVFDALDNRVATTDSETNGETTTGKDMNFREEPVAFFFVLFGLAYEALVTQARDNQAHALAILSALKRILTPAVSGTAIYQDAVFDETTDTLDRLALTSTTEIQAVLVQIARNLSLNHVIAKSDGRHDKISEDINQLFELTRIIILVLSGLIPTLEESPSQATRPLSEDNINLIQISFQALVDVADVFPDVIRSDLYACIMHCYCTILATGMCQEEVIPRIMPIFRSFLQQMFKSEAEAQTKPYSKLIISTLTRMLYILTIAQRRENDFSILCAKNTLLSITILLTTASISIPPTDKLVLKSMTELLDTLQDVGLAKISAGCIRSILLTPSKTPCEETISRHLWPRILYFVMDQSANDPETVKINLLHSLITSVSIFTTASARAAAMSVLVPSLLERATHPVPNGSKEDLAKESAARLLELAAVDGVAFRNIVVSLEGEQRMRLETLLRSAGLGKKESGHRRTETGTMIEDDEEEEEERAPAIALRMDF